MHMDVDGELFGKGSSSGDVADMLFDTSEDLHKTSLFASLESVIPVVPLFPRPNTRCKLDTDVTSSDELDVASTFTNTSSAANNGQLKDLVDSHELGLSIQHETPQLLMEGDTLDDQVAKCDVVQEVVNTSSDIVTMVLSTADDTPQDAMDDVSQLSTSSLCLPQSVEYTGVSPDPVSLPSLNSSVSETVSNGAVVAPVHPPFVTLTATPLNPSVIHSNSALGPSVPCVMNSVVTHTSCPASVVSHFSASHPFVAVNPALTVLASAPSSLITSLSSSLNGFVVNEFPTLTLSLPSVGHHHNSISPVVVSSHDTVSSTVEIDKSCDDIIGQSLILAHNAVHSPDQSKRSPDAQMLIHKPLDNKCSVSCEQSGSHEQQQNLHEEQKCSIHKALIDNTCEDVSTASPPTTAATTVTNVPTKMTFIDWTEMKRKYVTPPDYPSTPTPINIELKVDQNSSKIPVTANVKKSNSSKPTGKKRGWVKGRPRKKPVLKVVKMMPKPPRTGYMLYLSDCRGEMIKNNPHLSQGEVSNRLAKSWGKLPSEQRQEFMSRGYVDRQRYLKELAMYYHQRNTDFHQQDPKFDPEWAKKYLSQYLSSDSDGLYCPICNVQFTTLHNKHQHCLSRKHNEEVVRFVQESVNRHQNRNGGNENIPVKSKTHVSGLLGHPMDHFNSDTSHTDIHKNGDTEDGVIAAGSVSSTKNIVETHTHGTNNFVNAENQSNSTEDHMSSAEHYSRNAEDHMSTEEANMGSIEDHMSTEEAHIGSAKDHMSDEEAHMGSAEIASMGISENSPSSALDHSDTLRDSNNIDTSAISDSLGTSEDLVTVTESQPCCSSDHTCINVSIKEESHDQPLMHFPSHYSLSHVIHDFTLHQQDMISDLKEKHVLLQSRHAQLQSECNELEVKVGDMKEQLKFNEQENMELLSHMETLSQIIHSAGQADHYT